MAGKEKISLFREINVRGHLVAASDVDFRFGPERNSGAPLCSPPTTSESHAGKVAEPAKVSIRKEYSDPGSSTEGVGQGCPEIRSSVPRLSKEPFNDVCSNRDANKKSEERNHIVPVHP